VKIIEHVDDLASAACSMDFDPIGPRRLVPDGLLELLAGGTTVIALVTIRCVGMLAYTHEHTRTFNPVYAATYYVYSRTYLHPGHPPP
jgi:hypothetical protein